MSRLGLRGVLIAVGLGATGCPFLRCDSPPDSGASECWAHTLSDAANPTCTTASEHEPNETVSEANVLGSTTACSPRAVSGAVAADVDVFYGWGEPCDEARPRARLLDGPDDLRMCFFVSCVEGRTGLDQEEPCVGGDPFHTVEGLLGCCRTGPGSVEVHINCDAESTTLGRVPELDGYLFIDRLQHAECQSYGVELQL